MTAPQRFEQLHAQYAPMVHSMVWFRSRDQEQARDAEQAVWARLWGQLAENPGRPMQSGYLGQTAISEIGAIRKHEAVTGRNTLSLEHKSSDGTVVRPLLPHGEIDEVNVSEIRDAVGNLPPDLRELVDRHYYEGESLAVICKSTGLSFPTVKARLEEAHQLIRFGVRLTKCRHSTFKPDGSYYTADRDREFSIRRAYQSNQTICRERTRSGHLVFAHRPVSPAFLDVEAERWRDVCVGWAIPAPQRVEQPPSAITRRKKHGEITNALLAILKDRPGTPVSVLADLTGESPAAISSTLSRLRREGRIKTVDGRALRWRAAA